VKMPPGQKRSEVTTHAGEEFLYVIAGEVSLTLEGKTFVLHAGDSAHYESTVPHSWANTARVESVVVWVGTQDCFRSQGIRIVHVASNGMPALRSVRIPACWTDNRGLPGPTADNRARRRAPVVLSTLSLRSHP